jgi:hypothetical protein
MSVTLIERRQMPMEKGNNTEHKIFILPAAVKLTHVVVLVRNKCSICLIFRERNLNLIFEFEAK